MRRKVLAFVAMTAAMLLACGATVWAQESTISQGVDSDPNIVVLEESVVNPLGVARAIDQRQPGLEAGFIYTNALEGFSATIPDDGVAEVRANPNVAYVERDRVVMIARQRLPWGIDRVDADISSTRAGNGRGRVSNVNAYVIDTGIYAHSDLNVVNHVNFTGDGRNYDCYGHGTHVAGTVAAKDDARAVVGAAPGAPLTGVKVLGCDGAGLTSRTLEGIDWVTANAVGPAVANMSLSGPTRRTLDDAVRNSAASGIHYSIAAGNKGADACNYSPASAGAGTNNGITTVAATTKADAASASSNYGSCVDIWAPGENIISTKLGGGITTMSGTSTAAAHVGGAALYLSWNTTASPATVEGALKWGGKRRSPIVLENVGTF
ncbi:MAG TPA: S8 family serine peptidase [Rubrobacter sp.]|nr:S8 family serine peptidase [Rubrobacter sp.]